MFFYILLSHHSKKSFCEKFQCKVNTFFLLEKIFKRLFLKIMKNIPFFTKKTPIYCSKDYNFHFFREYSCNIFAYFGKNI